MSQVMQASSERDSLTLCLLLSLEKLGAIRSIDVQFARFIYQQCLSQASLHSYHDVDKQADYIALLAGVVSYEFGRGHICVRLDRLNIEECFSLAFWKRQSPELDVRFSTFLSQLQSIDWVSLVEGFTQQSGTLIGVVKEGNEQILAVPLMLERGRLYLTRYWHYESQVADGFLQRSKTLSFDQDVMATMQQTLNELFVRDYRFLWEALQSGEYTSAVARQRLVCEMLDVVETHQLDWERIDGLLTGATQVEQLCDLDIFVPLSVCLNWQKVAAAVALTRQFAVISGGPGTGKTTTVAKLLAALLIQSQQKQKQDQNTQLPIIKLVAPTGKAAARLTESIGIAIAQLPVSDEIKSSMPAQSSTIHRLLGARPNTVEYKYNQSNPLHLDILVVDEASMVDLPMMFRLLQALPEHARLILLGDKDQLASVEAGAILGDICQFTSLGYQQDFSYKLAALTQYQCLTNLPANPKANPIADSLCMLQKSYRFHARSGVGQLAKAINAGRPNEVERVWRQGFNDIELHALQTHTARDDSSASFTLEQAQQKLCQMLQEAYTPYCVEVNRSLDNETASMQGDLFASLERPDKSVMENKARMTLQAFAQARLLCAVREGEFGVERMNSIIEHRLMSQKQIRPVEGELWYIGRPVMISQNDSALGLHNGDIGICLLDESEEQPRLRVYFEMPDGRIKGVLPSRVPKHELAFAMTIHKSQGSEFAHTVMLLPNKMNQILTRELIYTGVTRAKSRLDLFANPGVLAQGIEIKTLRSSGLSDKLTSVN